MTLVGNDTGGAICQLVVTPPPRAHRPARAHPVRRLRDFLPPAFRYLQLLARVPGGVTAVAQAMRLPADSRSPIAFGWLSKRRIPSDVLAAWTAPVIRDAAIRRDVREVLRGISKRYTLEAATRLRDFGGPTMLAWATEDRFFKPRFAERLAGDIPGSGSSGSTTRARSSPRTSPSGWRRWSREFARIRRPRRTSAAGRRSSAACT